MKFTLNTWKNTFLLTHTRLNVQELPEIVRVQNCHAQSLQSHLECKRAMESYWIKLITDSKKMTNGEKSLADMLLLILINSYRIIVFNITEIQHVFVERFTACIC